MFKLGFGKRPKPRTFGFIPRYYDPDKEELEERLNKYKTTGDEAKDIDNMKSRIKSGMRLKYYGDANYKSSLVRRSNFRLIYIIVILLFLGYLLMTSNKFLALIEAFSK
ncbi:MAG: hypothetical protein WAU01_10115 [Saprospiraceae bacterium]